MNRYGSGSSLQKTDKETHIEFLERMIGDVSDGLFLGLKKLTMPQLKELHRLIAERIRLEATKQEE